MDLRQVLRDSLCTFLCFAVMLPSGCATRGRVQPLEPQREIANTEDERSLRSLEQENMKDLEFMQREAMLSEQAMSSDGQASVSHGFSEIFARYEEQIMGKDSRAYDRKGVLGEVIRRLRLQDDQPSQRDRPNNLYYSENFQAPIREAAVIAKQVQSYLMDGAQSREARFAALIGFLDHVYIPAKKLRTLLIDPKNPPSRVDLDALGHPRTLLPRIPAELVETPLSARKIELRGMLLERSATEVVLVPEPLLSLSQEVQDVGESATTENYFRAMKSLAVQMLLTQIKTLNLIRGNPSPTEVPHGCRVDPGMEAEGPIQSKDMSAEYRRQAITEILYRPGWLNPPERYKVGVVLPLHGPHAASSQYTEAQLFMNAVKAIERMEAMGDQRYILSSRPRYMVQNPEIDIESANALEAQAAPRLQAMSVDLEEPAIDDSKEFEGVIAMLLPKAQKLEKQLPGFKEWNENFERRQRELEEQLRLEGHDARYIIQKLDENRRKAPQGQVLRLTRFDPQSGLTEYWRNALERKEATNWKDLVSPALSTELSGNTMVFPMPPLRAPDSWRVWAMDQLALALENNTPAVLKILKDLKCPGGSHLKEKDCATVMARIYRQGVEHAMSDPQDALRTGSRLSQIYVLWGKAWDRIQALRGADRPAAMDSPMSEWDYMQENFDSNPWVQLRLGYLHLKSALPAHAQTERVFLREHGARGGLPVTTVSKIWDYIAGELGVRLPLQPFQANRVLKFAEKKQYWAAKVAEFDRLKILKVRRVGGTTNAPDRSVAEIANAVVMRGIETAEESKLVMQRAFSGQQRSNPAWYSDLEGVFSAIENDSREGRQARLVNELVGLERLESPRSAEIVEKLLIDEGMESFQLRGSLILASDAYKRPTLEKLLEYASTRRLGDLSQNVNDLCRMNLYDGDRPARKRFGELYYAIINEQAEFERVLGYRGMPESIRKLLHPGFFESLMNAEGALTAAQLLLMVGAFTAGSACMLTVVAAPACAAIFLGYIATQAGIVKISVDRYREGLDWRVRAHFFKETGMTTDDAISEMVDVGGFGLAFNAVSMYPGLQMTARGAKMLHVSGKLGISRALSMVAATPVGRAAPALGRRAVTLEVDLLNDLRLARLASLAEQEVRLAAQTARVAEEAGSEGFWAHVGRIGGRIRSRFSRSATEFVDLSRREINLGPLVLKNSAEEIKRAIAVQVARRFAGKPEGMLTFLSHFEKKMAKMHRKALKEMERASATGRAVSEHSREFMEQHAKYQALVAELRTSQEPLVNFLEKNAHRVS